VKVLTWAVFAIWVLVGLRILTVSTGTGIAWLATGMPVVLIAGNWYRRPRRKRRA
jgi:hypothetical protein